MYLNRNQRRSKAILFECKEQHPVTLNKNEIFALKKQVGEEQEKRYIIESFKAIWLDPAKRSESRKCLENEKWPEGTEIRE